MFPGPILICPGPILIFPRTDPDCSRTDPEFSRIDPGFSRIDPSDKIGKVFFAKTRVGFGRTELSLRLSCTEFCALSSGHGPRGRGFEGFCKTLDVHDFWGGLKLEKT